jgi:hypothetical protein
MFSCVPIPFVKKGGLNFANSKFGKFLIDMKKLFDDVADVVSGFFKNYFRNPVIDAFTSFKEQVLDPLDKALASPFEWIDNTLNDFVDNDYEKLKTTFPYLAGNAVGSIQATFDALELSLGKAQAFSDNYQIGPFTLGQLATAAENASLQASLKRFKDHTDALSGVKSTMAYELIALYGNVASVGATVNIASSNVVSPNLSSTAYPKVDYGDTITINSQTKVVTEKTFTAHPTGTVSVDVSTNNVKVTTADTATLNLLSCLLSTSGIINLNSSMFITVDDTIRRINSINAAGDYLIVDIPFYSSASGVQLFKETSFIVNSAFTTTTTDQIVYVKTPFVCNTVCLDNVITGNGTSWSSQLEVGDKIIYDTKEFFVEGVTNDKITVDGEFRETKNFIVHKVNNEIEVVSIGEDIDPDEIINGFTMIETMTGDPNFMKGVKSKVRLANGKYASVNTENPTDAAQALFRKDLIEQAKNALTEMKYELNDAKVRGLNDTQVNTKITSIITKYKNIKDDLEAVISRDKQIIKNVKNFVSALGKLFSLSCGKKKKKKGDSSSDDYLNVITVPYAPEDGCDATTGNFIDILDDFDFEFNQDNFTVPNITSNTNINATNQFDGSDIIVGPLPSQTLGIGTGGESNVGIDGRDPSVNVPEDPCAKPC